MSYTEIALMSASGLLNIFACYMWIRTGKRLEAANVEIGKMKWSCKNRTCRQRMQ